MSYIVISGADSGIGTLRDALEQAVLSPIDYNITFDPTVTVVSLQSSLSVNNGSIATININGNGSSVLNIIRASVDQFRIFSISNSLINITGLTISGGTGGIGAQAFAGGLYISNSTMTFNDVIITNNTASIIGGGLFIDALSDITMINVEVSNNRCIPNASSNGGGIYINNSTVTINNSSIHDNSATGNSGGISNNISTLTINNSSIYNNSVINNTTSNNGGGIYVLGTTNTTISNSTLYNNTAYVGAGIYLTGTPTMNIVNSTISGNTAITNAGAMRIVGVLSLINSTISANDSGATAAIVINSGTTSLGNTIIAQNINSGSTVPDIIGDFTSLGTNLFGIYNASVASGIIASDLSGTMASPLDAMLQPLADNGGPTLTMALPIDSPAVNAGNNAIIPPGIIYDQRGFPFARISGLSVDIGAFEYVFAAICYSGDSLVLTKNICTAEITEIPVCQVYSDTHLVYNVIDNCYVPVKLNIVTGKVDRMILIPKNALEENKPSEDFIVTSGHYLLINGSKVKARNIAGRKRIKVSSQDVYSICTDTECAIKVNNLDVMTWGYDSWITKSKERGINWYNNNSFINKN